MLDHKVHANFHKQLAFSFFALFVLVVVVSTTGWFVGANTVRSAESAQFERISDGITWWISSRVSVFHVVLRGLSSYFQNSEEVTLDEWSSYVKELSLTKYYPGVSAFGFSRKVTHQEIPAYEREMKRLYPDFELHIENPQLDTHYLVTYVEPYVGRERSLGYDQAADPERKRLIEQVRDTGNIDNTDLIKLATTGEPGFFLAAPIYEPNLPLGTVEQRRAAFVGVAFATFRKDQPFEAIFAEHDPFPDVDIEVYNNETFTPQGLLYDSDPSVSALNPPGGTRYHKTIPLYFEEYKWTIALASKPQFGMGQLERTLSFIPPIAGTILSIALFVIGTHQVKRYKELEREEEK